MPSLPRALPKVKAIIIGCADMRVDPAHVLMHDFALTKKYVVLYDLPVTFSLDAAKAGRFPYVWNPAHEARVGLLSREDSSRGTRWFPVEPCFVFHTLNAYDDGDRV